MPETQTPVPQTPGPRLRSAPGAAPSPNAVAKTPNPFLLFVEIVGVAIMIGVPIYLEWLTAHPLVAGGIGLVGGFAVVLLLNTTRLRPLMLLLWAGGLGGLAWYMGYGPILTALAALAGIGIKTAEIRFLDKHRD